MVELISTYRAKTEFKLTSEETSLVEDNVDKYQSLKDKDNNAEVTVTTASGTPTATASGTPTATATGTPTATATGEETVSQNEVLDLEDSDQEETLNIFENLMATATQKSHDFGLPMFIGICLPPKKYKK